MGVNKTVTPNTLPYVDKSGIVQTNGKITHTLATGGLTTTGTIAAGTVSAPTVTATTALSQTRTTSTSYIDVATSLGQAGDKIGINFKDQVGTVGRIEAVVGSGFTSPIVISSYVSGSGLVAQLQINTDGTIKGLNTPLSVAVEKTTAPDPAITKLWIDTSGGVGTYALKIYNGSAWVLV